MDCIRKDKFKVSLNMDFIPDKKHLVFEFIKEDDEKELIHRFDIAITRESLENQIKFLESVREKL